MCYCFCWNGKTRLKRERAGIVWHKKLEVLCPITEREREKARKGHRGILAAILSVLSNFKMKALLLLVLPWLSPANYIDNVGNLHFLYSELWVLTVVMLWWCLCVVSVLSVEKENPLQSFSVVPLCVCVCVWPFKWIGFLATFLIWENRHQNASLVFSLIKMLETAKISPQFSLPVSLCRVDIWVSFLRIHSSWWTDCLVDRWESTHILSC